MASFSALRAYPLSPIDALRKPLAGQMLEDVPTPAAIIDVAKARKNCKLMLDAVERLGVKFRAHVKTHKTAELTRLQLGAGCKDVRLVVSTVIEAEHLVPLLLDYQANGASVNVLYGLPVGSSHIDRLASVGQALGSGSVSVMIDHLDQLKALARYKALAGSAVGIFIKVDVGYFRAGISPASTQMAELVLAATALEHSGSAIFHGFYSHAGHSYAGSSPQDAMSMLSHEISVAISAVKARPSSSSSSPLTISVGASPTILSVQNLFSSGSSSSPSTNPDPASEHLLSLLDSTTHSPNFTLELHAGVYPLLDLQQLATHARPSASADVALTILAEVVSLYPDRTPGKPEALIAAGCLALGREPCKSYAGWGVVAPWGREAAGVEDGPGRMIVSRISQEHGIVAYEDATAASSTALALAIGQKVRIWPNHACIASAMFGFYVVVDSEAAEPDRVVDVWVRGRGW